MKKLDLVLVGVMFILFALAHLYLSMPAQPAQAQINLPALSAPTNPAPKPTPVPITSTPKPMPTPTPHPVPKPTPVHDKQYAFVYHISWGKPKKQNKYAIPKGYYDYPFKKYKPTYANLIKVLNVMKCPHAYNARTFRCSHFAAYGEWYLENHGFKTDIVVITWKIEGKRPKFSGHAIDLVHTVDGDYYVDPTILICGVHGKDLIVPSIKSEVPSGCKLVNVTIDHNIYQAMHDIGYPAIDWWKTTGYPPRFLS